MILPASSCHGRTEVSRISTIRLPFSSTTPMATIMTCPMISMNSTRTSTTAIPVLAAW